MSHKINLSANIFESKKKKKDISYNSSLFQNFHSIGTINFDFKNGGEVNDIYEKILLLYLCRNVK
jgi:hypothetical protein